MLDKPLVDEQKLLAPRAAGEGRLPDKPLHPYHICALFDGHQALIVLAPEHANDALAQGGRPQIKQLAIVVGEREINGLVRQRDAVKFIDDVPHFNGVGFQKVSTGGHVEKQVAHGNLGTHFHRHGGFLGQGPSFHVQLGAALIARVARLQFDMSNRRNRSQRLATESFGHDGEQVVGRRDFGGGVAVKAALRIGLDHAHSVVHHMNQRATGVHNAHVNARGTGIHGVFHQLLHRRSRPLNDLPRCNLIRYIFWQLPYHLRHPPSTLVHPKNHWSPPTPSRATPTRPDRPQ